MNNSINTPAQLRSITAPSCAEGRKTGVWTTRAAERLENDISFELEGDIVAYQAEGKKYSVSIDTALIAALMPAFLNKSGLKLADHLTILQNNLQSKQQLIFKESGGKVIAARTVLDNPKKLLTAAEYKANAIGINLEDNKESLTNIVDRLLVASEQDTKKQLVDLINEVKDLLFDIDQRATYFIIEESEAGNRKKLQALTNYGITDIVATTSGFTATVPRDKSMSLVSTLTANNFKLDSHDLDLDSGSLNIVFSAIEELTI